MEVDVSVCVVDGVGVCDGVCVVVGVNEAVYVYVLEDVPVPLFDSVYVYVLEGDTEIDGVHEITSVTGA